VYNPGRLRVVPVTKKPVASREAAIRSPNFDSARQWQLERRSCPPQSLPSSCHS